MADYSNLTYRELQEKVSALGHKAVGKKREELIELLKNASPNAPEKALEEQKEAANKDLPSTEEKKENPVSANVAIVFQGSTELRRYTHKKHGENFEDLARAYASHKGGTVVLKDFGEQTICPHCGRGFYPKG